MIRFSCTSFSFPLLRLPEAARLVALLGFEYIDLCIADGDRDVRAAEVEAEPVATAARDREALSAAGVHALDVFAHLGGSAFDRPVNTADAELRSSNRRRFGAYLDYAQSVGAEGVTISPGTRDGDAAFERAASELAVCAAQAAERGLRLSVEPHVDSIAATPETAKRLVDAVPGLTLTVDYSHFVARRVPQREVDQLLSVAGHVHVRQAAPGRLQVTEEEGEIDFDAVADRLVAAGYSAGVTLEYLWSRWQGMNRVDVVTETLLLRRRLSNRLAQLENQCPTETLTESPS